MMQKRTALKLVLAGAAAAMLAGCGDKTEAPKEAAAPEKTAAAPADKAAGPYGCPRIFTLHGADRDERRPDRG